MTAQIVIKSGYKQTELGIIPDDWKITGIFDICRDIFLGLTTSVDYVNFKGFPLVRANNISKGIVSFKNIRFISKKQHEFLTQFHKPKQGDILVTKSGSLGVCAIVDSSREFSIYESIIDLQPNPDLLDSKFLLYFLRQNKIQKKLKRDVVGSTVGHLNLIDFRKLKITFPSLPEQTAIAKILSNTDELIRQLDYLITKKKNIKQGAMQELLTGKRRVKRVSGKWESKKLGDITNITMGQSPKSKFYNKKGIGLPLIQGNADIRDRKTIVRSFTSVSPMKGYKTDTIMSVRAPVGEIAKATFDCCLGRGVCAISYVNAYIYHYMIFIENRWASLSTGSTFDSINSKEINNLELFLPNSKEEQFTIAKVLSDMDSEIKEIETKKDKYIMMKNGMVQKLLTGEIRLI